MYQVFRLITSFRSYLALGTLIILIMATTKINVDSFRWVSSLGVVTNIKRGELTQVKYQSIADNAVQLTYTNIILWHQEESFWTSSSWDVLQWTDQEKALQLIKVLKELRQQSLQEVQKTNPDSSTIADFTNFGKRSVSQGNILVQSLEQSMNSLQNKMNNCIVQKKQADERYNQWLVIYDSNLIAQATTQAQEANVCISTSSTSINSTKGIRSTLQKELERTSAYISLLEQNKQLFIRYGEVLGTEIPNQLLKLQNELKRL